MNMSLLMRIESNLQKLSLTEIRWLIERLTQYVQQFKPTESTSLTLEKFVAQIQATPPNPANVRPAKGSLAEALRHGPTDPDFNLAEWNRQWETVEAEMKAITKANDVAEGFI